MPGSAIGSTMSRLTVCLPKKSNRCSAKAASVPSRRAMSIAPRPTMTELPTAVHSASFSNAATHQRKENSSMGQLGMRAALNELTMTSSSGTYMNTSTTPTMAPSTTRAPRVSLSMIGLPYIRSRAPVRRVASRYSTTNATGTIENAAATGGLRLMLLAMIEPIIWVAPPTSSAAM